MDLIVTGAGKGIGFETVRHLGKLPGNRIIAISRNIEKLHELATKANPLVSEIIPLKFDIVNGSIKNNLIPFLSELDFRIDGLFNNAGALVNKPFAECSDEDFNLVMRTNLDAPFRIIRDLLPLMNKGSHIINAGSMGGVQGSAKFPGLALYSASKGALAILTECLAEELKDRKISVNCLAFGAVQTEMLAAAFPGYQAPLSASEMAVFVADFLVKGHKYFNGKVLPVSVSTP
ncbi:MAG: SDR family oxidoreductase [Bacteroidales bacterium]|nr:SDR family oxidoreductase [Bacteroidales bacterium]